MKMSVAIIVRNEEACIKRCLVNIIGKFDEYIVVDSGSEDKTLAIIENEFYLSRTSYILLESVWNDDFSALRNLAIENATSNAILFIDADEILLSDGNTIRYAFEEIEIPLRNCLAICPSIKNHDDDVIGNLPRGFYLNEGFYYYGFVHEELRSHVNVKIKRKICNIFLHHDGYKGYIVKNKKKINRNFLLNQKNILAEPENVRWVYFYCRDSIGIVDNEDLYQTAFRSLLIDKNITLSKDNVIESNHTIALLELMMAIKLECYRSKSMEDDYEFHNLINIMESLGVSKSNVFFYKMTYDILMWEKKCKRNLIEIIDHVNNNKDRCNGILHSEGYHFHQLLGVYLYENKMFSASYRILELVSRTGYSGGLLKKYLKYFEGYQK